MSAIEFQSFDKIPRLFRDMTVTEKIDGTNAAIGVLVGDEAKHAMGRGCQFQIDGETYLVYAQSRKRMIAPEDDNYGFARWVWDNAPELARALGPGLHFGEWWGQGIQRDYGLTEKRFSLFNTHRWHWLSIPEARAEHDVLGQLYVVPVLDAGTFDTKLVEGALARLKVTGSEAAPGFLNPEGVCVYHSAGNHLYKATFEMDVHKSELALAS